MIEISTLANGVKVVYEYMESVRSVAFGIWVANGSRYESEDTSGISHFIEHMLFKGTQKRTAKDIANEMDYVGGQINAFTSREYTCYHTRTLDTHFERAFDVIADMFFNSVFDDADIKKESRVILEEISMYEDSPEDLAHELVSENVFKGNSLSYPILGTKKTVSSFDSKKILGFLRHRYLPANTVISIAGSFEKQRVLDTVEKYFGDFKAEEIADDDCAEPKYTPAIIKKIKDIEQAHVCVTFPGVKHGADEVYALSIFDTIFGGGMSSRLFQKIREDKGLAYSIYSCPTTYKHAGIYSIYAGMSEESAQKVLRLISKEIKLLKKDEITKKQVQKTKEQIKSSYIIGLESTSNRMVSLGRTLTLLDKIQTTEEIINKIDATSVDAVYNVSDKIFDMSKICASAVGKVKKLDIEGAFS